MAKQWDAFISHASEDKDKVVRELANILETLHLKVWYDEFALEVGDSLSKKIDEGLLQSNFGIVIISKAFLNKKWTDYEYRSLITKEENGRKVILPVWYDITVEEVKKFSLFLADKIALDTSKNKLKQIAVKLLKVVRPDIYDNLFRYLMFKKILKDGKTKMVKASELKWGEKLRDELPKSMVVRIKNIFYGIGQCFNSTLERTIECYLYDARPDREIQTWEIMNACYLEFIKANNVKNSIYRQEVAKVLLGFSIGNLRRNEQLSEQELYQLFELWKANAYEY